MISDKCRYCRRRGSLGFLLVVGRWIGGRAGGGEGGGDVVDVIRVGYIPTLKAESDVPSVGPNR